MDGSFGPDLMYKTSANLPLSKIPQNGKMWKPCDGNSGDFRPGLHRPQRTLPPIHFKDRRTSKSVTVIYR